MDVKKIAHLLRQLADELDVAEPAAPTAPTAPADNFAPVVEAPAAADLVRFLSEASKQHGRAKIASIVGNKRVSEMTDAERLELAHKLEAL